MKVLMINGAVLSIVQRMFYSNGAAFAGKPAAAVAVCRRGGATAAFQALNMPFMMMNHALCSGGSGLVPGSKRITTMLSPETESR